jgi:D-alanyl-D-alanine carboxypeptidase/D-alanyl-D-alanine-endopeptidase (penicillin-binding protein 4)
MPDPPEVPAATMRGRRRVLSAAWLGASLLGAHSVARGATPTPGSSFARPSAKSIETGANPGVWAALSGAAPGELGAVARPVAGGAPLVDWNPRVPLNPASTMKVVTTYAALGLLGPDHRWQTTLHLDGVLRDGVLSGNLILRGGGDPKLVIEDMRALIVRMRAAGLSDIRGDLLIDDALFDLGTETNDSLDGEPWQPYNVPPHPALMNFKATRIVVRGEAGRVRISLDPPLADVRVRNELQVLDGPCGTQANALWIRDRDPGVSSPFEIRVGGRYVPACGEQSVYAAVLGHREFIHGFFKAAWRAAGGRFEGRTRVARGAAVTPVWMQWESPRTLRDVIQDINKYSNNVMTRQLLLTLAAQPGGPPASPERARQKVLDWLVNQGLRMPELVIENGSGLSRAERISAGSLTELLVHADRGPHAAELRASLPRVGFDGTMRGRLRRHAIAGHAWIKTGSLRDVRSIAGYVDAASGRRYAVAMIANGPRLLGAQPAQDAFLRWVHEHG